MTDHLDDVRSAVNSVIDRDGSGNSLTADIDPIMWGAFEQLGFTTVTVPTELGGSGGDLRDATAVVQAAAQGRVPLGEALLLAGPALSDARLLWPDGIVTASIAPEIVVRGTTERPLLSGRVDRVPWLRGADHVVLLLPGKQVMQVAVVDVRSEGFIVLPGSNLAGEPRDEALLTDTAPTVIADLPQEWNHDFAMLHGALCRAGQIAGAARQALTLTARHVSERIQFGRTLAQFQSVQHQIARLAADVVTLEVAADAAAIALRDRTPLAYTLVAAAKAQASSSAHSICVVSHQLHGALGFSQEHPLGMCTRRIWAWREEYGNELTWHNTLARQVVDASDDVWAVLTGTDGGL